MRIRNHKLYDDQNRAIRFVKADKKSGALEQEYLIIHYTAGGAGEQTVNFFRSSQARASAHLVIGRDGSITQMVKFDRIAWHAGKSEWANRNRLNPYSIGIELANWGLLKQSNGSYKSWTGRTVPSDLVIKAPHKHTPATQRYWEIFPEAQIEAAVAVSAAITATYNIPPSKILGHDDISPGRKVDPGPAFDMSAFRAMVSGRSDDIDIEQELFIVRSATGLNLREGAGTNFAIIKNLPDGTKVRRHLGEEMGRWWAVTALDENGNETVTGHVHSSWLRAV